MKYEKYVQKACNDLQRSQGIFRDEYDINNYTSWFYNQSSEILRLYGDEKEIHFQYIPVGTFSRNTKTWMWAWANEDSVEPRKLRTLRIKEFGERKNYPNLIQAHFKGDEYTGWELTAIAFQLIGGIGTYRVISDHFEKYFLITGEISKETAKKIERELIECSLHGKIRKAFVCQHLHKKQKAGFEEAFETYKGMELNEDDDLQAWCDECEKERIKTDGWNDESMEFAKIKLVCERCYFDIKELNLNQ